MRTVLRVVVAVVLGLHGLVHLLGVLSGFELADVAGFREPVSRAGGVLWYRSSATRTG